MKEINYLILTLLFFCLFTGNSYAQLNKNLPIKDNETKYVGCYIKEPPVKKKQDGIVIVANPPQNADEIIKLPVVFHFLHSNQSVSRFDAEDAEAAINGINEDFSGKNPDFLQLKKGGKLPPEFANAVADTKIQFCLAHTNQEGKAFNGIVDVYWGAEFKSFTPFSSDLYNTKKGGSTPWDNNKYINVYIVENLKNPNVGGYASEATNIVLDWKVGNDWIAIEDFTHEMGHYLGLKHTWGGKKGKEIGCNIDDDVADTPPQEKPSSDNIDYSEIKKKGFSTKLFSCQGSSSQYINFMDYSNYQYIFTPGQKNKMREYINNSLANLKNSTSCNMGQCKNDTYDQLQSNNSDMTASEIFPNKWKSVGNGLMSKGHYYGILCIGDVDWYRFTTVNGKKTSVSVEGIYYKDPSKNQPIYIKPTLYKKINNSLTPVSLKTKGNGTEYTYISPTAEDGKTQYYLKIEGKTVSDYHPLSTYHFQVFTENPSNTNQTPSACEDYDANETPNTATLLFDSVKVLESICSVKDIDYYKVYLSSVQQLEGTANTLHIKLVNLYGNNTDLDVKLYNSEGLKLSPANLKGTATEEFTDNLPDGYYFIEVTSKSNIDAYINYQLTVDFHSSFDIDPNLEPYFNCTYPNTINLEPNDLPEQATVLKNIDKTPNSKFYAGILETICPANDNDFYEITLAKSSTYLRVDLAAEDSYYLPEDYDLNFYSATDNKIYYYSQGEGTQAESIVINKTLPAGKYYIVVYPVTVYNYNGKYPYKLTVNATYGGGKEVPNDLPLTIRATIFPNPAKDMLTITLEESLSSKDALATIANQYGRTFISGKRIEIKDGKVITPLSVLGYPKGWYTLSMIVNTINAAGQRESKLVNSKFLVD